MPYKEIATQLGLDTYGFRFYNDVPEHEIRASVEKSYQLLEKIWQSAILVAEEGSVIDPQVFERRFIMTCLSVSIPGTDEPEYWSTETRDTDFFLTSEEALEKYQYALLQEYLEGSSIADTRIAYIAFPFFQSLARRLFDEGETNLDTTLVSVLRVPYFTIEVANKKHEVHPLKAFESGMIALNPNWNDPPVRFTQEKGSPFIDAHIHYVSHDPVEQILRTFHYLPQAVKEFTPEESATHIRGVSHLLRRNGMIEVITNRLHKRYGYEPEEIQRATNITVGSVLCGEWRNVYEVIPPWKIFTVAYSNIRFSQEYILKFFREGIPPAVGFIIFPADKMFS